MRLNLACGDRPREGYLNLDIVPGKGDEQADCLNLTFSDGLVSEILAEHRVEHLTRPELFGFFAQAMRLIRSGGLLGLRTPCMRCILAAHAKGRITIEQADLYLFARHLHEHDFHRQGIFEEKLRRLHSGFGFSDPEFSHGPDYELSSLARRI